MAIVQDSTTPAKLLESARQMAIDGDASQAVGLLERIEQNPSADNAVRLQCWMIRGKIHARQRDFDQAIASFDRALQLDRDNTEAHAARRLCQQMKRSSLSRFLLWSKVIILCMGTMIVVLAAAIAWQMYRRPTVELDRLDQAITPVRDMTTQSDQRLNELRVESSVQRSTQAQILATAQTLQQPLAEIRERQRASEAWQERVNQALSALDLIQKQATSIQAELSQEKEQLRQLQERIKQLDDQRRADGAALGTRLEDIEKALGVQGKTLSASIAEIGSRQTQQSTVEESRATAMESAVGRLVDHGNATRALVDEMKTIQRDAIVTQSEMSKHIIEIERRMVSAPTTTAAEPSKATLRTGDNALPGSTNGQ